MAGYDAPIFDRTGVHEDRAIQARIFHDAAAQGRITHFHQRRLAAKDASQAKSLVKRCCSTINTELLI